MLAGLAMAASLKMSGLSQQELKSGHVAANNKHQIQAQLKEIQKQKLKTSNQIIADIYGSDVKNYESLYRKHRYNSVETGGKIPTFELDQKKAWMKAIVSKSRQQQRLENEFRQSYSLINRSQLAHVDRQEATKRILRG